MSLCVDSLNGLDITRKAPESNYNVYYVADEYALSVGETRSFLYSLINKGLLEADLSQDDLTCNPSVWCNA